MILRAALNAIPVNESYVRVEHLKSSWRIKQLTNDIVEIDYQTWLNPAGNVPAYFFNQALFKQTKKSISKLQTLINSTPSH